MTYLLLSIASLLIAVNSYSQGNLKVIVKNIKTEKGDVRVGLFTNEKDFLKKAADGKVAKVSGTEVTVVFENLAPGEYAVSVIHDENGNGELDTNFMGIPKEGFAFGNNAMGTFGPPSFDKAKVKIEKEDIVQEIKLKYM